MTEWSQRQLKVIAELLEVPERKGEGTAELLARAAEAHAARPPLGPRSSRAWILRIFGPNRAVPVLVHQADPNYLVFWTLLHVKFGPEGLYVVQPDCSYHGPILRYSI